MDLKAFLQQHKVKARFVGGALVVSTAYGSCNLMPSSEPEAPAVEEPAADEAPEEEVPAEADDAAPEEGEEASEEE